MGRFMDTCRCSGHSRGPRRGCVRIVDVRGSVAAAVLGSERPLAVMTRVRIGAPTGCALEDRRSDVDIIRDRHPIALAAHAESLVIDGDVDRLRRVVENLITNAMKYSPAGGAMEVCLSEEAGSAVITVRDHGIGIPEEARGRIFELGYRSAQAEGVAPGLGLGLYTAAEIIRRHSGTIEAMAAEGGGSTFTVRIPLARRGPAAREVNPAPSPAVEESSTAVH